MVGIRGGSFHERRKMAERGKGEDQFQAICRTISLRFWIRVVTRIHDAPAVYPLFQPTIYPLSGVRDKGGERVDRGDRPSSRSEEGFIGLFMGRINGPVTRICMELVL